MTTRFLTLNQSSIPEEQSESKEKSLREKTLRLFNFEPMEGIEPTTPRLQITCSGQLSYIGKMDVLFSKGMQKYEFFWNYKRFCQNISQNLQYFFRQCRYTPGNYLFNHLSVNHLRTGNIIKLKTSIGDSHCNLEYTGIVCSIFFTRFVVLLRMI